MERTSPKSVTTDKGLWVNGRFQANHLASMGVLVAVSFLMSGLALAWIILYGMDHRLIHLENHAFFWRMAVVFFFFLIGMGIWSLRYTRSIAAPIDALCESLEQASRGSYPDAPLHFSRTDLFKRVAQPLNHCLHAMENQQSLQTRMVGEVESLLQEVEQTEMSSREVQKALQGILSIVPVETPDP